MNEKARTLTELPNSYMPSGSLDWTLKPGRLSSIFSPVIPAGADNSASRVIETVAVGSSVPIATAASETRRPVTTTSSTCWARAPDAGAARALAKSRQRKLVPIFTVFIPIPIEATRNAATLQG